jgi:hypothetical protein
MTGYSHIIAPFFSDPTDQNSEKSYPSFYEELKATLKFGAGKTDHISSVFRSTTLRKIPGGEIQSPQ